jgi:predicted ATPase
MVSRAHESLAVNQRHFFGAEIQRLNGELLLDQSDQHSAEAEQWFHKSLDIARNQSMKSFELRAATSLARLWQSQGKRKESYDLLAPVYGWFAEGLDAADLQDAKALLDELASPVKVSRCSTL